VAVICGLAIVWLSTLGPAQSEPPRKRAEAMVAPSVKFAQVEDIVISRCSMCHAAEPVWSGITVPPKGVLLDTAPRIRANAREIAIAAVWSNAMPPSNVTDITVEEREMLGAWVSGDRE
jgi:uncharacterized membrane protein